jgi:pyruvate ferredoxin oxidoreductase gamma subunit
VQDSPVYGAERRGAPVVAFTRVAAGPIRERGYIEAPDAVAVLDESLLEQPEAAVLDGVDEATLLLVNTRHPAGEVAARLGTAARVVTLDVSAIALELLGHHLLGAPAAGFAVKATRLARWELLAEAVRIELAEVGLDAGLVARNLRATRRAFDAAPAPGLAERAAVRRAPVAAPFRVPHVPARFAAPSVSAAATSRSARRRDGASTGPSSTSPAAAAASSASPSVPRAPSTSTRRAGPWSTTSTARAAWSA